MFYFERILERISKSKYNSKIILKGGLLLTSIIGENDRTTKDMDATLKGIPLTTNEIKKVFNEILSIYINDNVSFEIISIKDIRLEDEYGGYRINILSILENNRTYITIELTTGDVITPREIKYNYNSIFEDKRIPIMAYTTETILAEKFQSIIERALINTRMKDYYDIYMLMNDSNQFDKNILIKAIRNTFAKRNSKIDTNLFKMIIEDLKFDDNMKKLWIQYQRKNAYVRDIPYEEAIASVNLIIDIIDKELIEI